MAEPTTVDNGSLADYDVAVDDLGPDGVAGLAKLLVSADGSSARIPADAANGLDVDVTRVQGTVTVDGTVALSGTSPVSAASLPLPAGAATAAKQPALGTAGTASSDVLSVQGISGGTALPVSDGGGTLSVDDGAGSLTVDGTVTANAGTGPWPVTDNGGSLTVDGTVAVSGTTAVSAASLPLPSGASTSAKQPTLGTAGTPSSDVLTVQGVTSMTALKTDGSATTQPVSAASLPLPSGAATAAKQPALGTAGSASTDVITVQGIASGTVIPVSDGGGSLTVDGTVAVSGTVAVTDNSGSLTVDGSVTADTELTTKDYDSGAGTDTQAVVGILLPKSGGAVAGGTSSDPLRVDPTGTTAQPVTDNGGSLTVDGTVAATQSGTWNVGTVTTVTNVVHVDDNSSTLSIDDGGGSITVDGSLTLASPTVTRQRQASSGLTTAVTTYAIGDTAGTILTFTSAAAANGGSGELRTITLLDKGDVGTDYRLHIFRATVTLASDNAAWAVSDSDQESLIGMVTVPTLADVGANRIATLGNVGLSYDCAATSLFVGIETRAANSVYAAATDLNLSLTYAQS